MSGMSKRHKQPFTHSVRHALAGLRLAYSEEKNFRIQVWAGIAVIIALFVFDVSYFESLIVLLLVCMVLILELLNTSAEKTLDVLKPRLNIHVQSIKDILAAAVFTASLFAGVIGLIIFIPRLVELIGLA